MALRTGSIFFALMLWIPLSAYSEPVRVASLPSEQLFGCDAWKKKFESLVKPGAKITDQILADLAAVPEHTGLKVQWLIPRDKETYAFIWKERVYSQKGCDIAYYDVSKQLLALKGLSLSEKKKLILVFQKQLTFQADDHGTVISAILMSKVFETLIDQNWLTLTDAQYFEFSRLMSEILAERDLEVETNRSGKTRCESTECAEEDAKQDLHYIREYVQNVHRIYGEFDRWNKRIAPLSINPEK